MENCSMFDVNDKDKEVTCDSIYLAASLYASGIRLLSAIPRQGRSSAFVFDNQDGAADVAVKAYFTRKALLPAKDVFEALSQLKREANAAVGKAPREAARHS
jgi:hypothetical protein